jgi:protein-S-isoprenylcysteine O-methyltransferase Ste14
MKLALQTLVSSLAGLAFFGLVLFLPAGTFNYWQAWVFIVVFCATTLGPSAYLAVAKPAALRRRLHAGRESRPAQRILAPAIFALSGALFVVSALDHRYGWSTVPMWGVVLGNVLVAGGLLLAQLVVVQNNYAAANITVEEGQPLASTGLYGVVRHPMYAGALVMMIGTPPALDSWWGLVVVLPALVVLVARIHDEERMLVEELDGYRDYTTRVKSRLVPFLW